MRGSAPRPRSGRRPARLGVAGSSGLRLHARRLGVLRPLSRVHQVRLVDRVFLTPPRQPRPVAVRLPAPPVRPVDLHLAVVLPPAARRHGRESAPGLPPASATPAAPPERPVAARPPRMVLLVERAAREASVTRHLTTPAPAVPAVHGATAVHRTAPAAAPSYQPPPLPLVHRSAPPVPAPAGPAAGASPAAQPPRLAVRWAGADAAAAAPLTGTDVPVVVDRVVRAIEDRLSADRERRGWPG